MLLFSVLVSVFRVEVVVFFWDRVDFVLDLRLGGGYVWVGVGKIW